MESLMESQYPACGSRRSPVRQDDVTMTSITGQSEEATSVKALVTGAGQGPATHSGRNVDGSDTSGCLTSGSLHSQSGSSSLVDSISSVEAIPQQPDLDANPEGNPVMGITGTSPLNGKTTEHASSYQDAPVQHLAIAPSTNSMSSISIHSIENESVPSTSGNLAAIYRRLERLELKVASQEEENKKLRELINNMESQSRRSNPTIHPYCHDLIRPWFYGYQSSYGRDYDSLLRNRLGRGSSPT